jgi:plasmid maintenance system antidote protein VapI
MTLNYNFRELIFKYVDGTLNMDLPELLIGRKSLTKSTAFEVESLFPSTKTIWSPFSEKMHETRNSEAAFHSRPQLRKNRIRILLTKNFEK